MRGFLTKITPSFAVAKKLLILGVIIGVGVGAFFWGRHHADAQNGVPATPGETTAGYNSRIVAYLYDGKPVYREELGEYLIARFGAERLEFMINRKIVETECGKRGISASDAEVEHRFKQDLYSFGTAMTEKEFVNNILKRFNKTLYEWKEDVIRPKLMMEKLVRSQIKVTENDLREGYEARFGPKVDCRMIVLDGANLKVAQDVWAKVKGSRIEFDSEARKQAIPNLAQSGGKVPAIHKHFGDKRLEETAFSLKEGEVSGLLELPDRSLVILYCDRHIPADRSASFEAERAKLHKEMEDLRVAQRIPEEFKSMLAKAQPKYMLTGTGHQVVSNISPQSATAPVPRIDGPNQPIVEPKTQPTPEPLRPTPVTGPNGVAPVLPDAPLKGLPTLVPPTPQK